MVTELVFWVGFLVVLFIAGTLLAVAFYALGNLLPASVIRKLNEKPEWED